MRLSLLALILFLASFCAGQERRLSGRVTDEKGTPIKGASVSLDHTIDGATTDSAGYFSFSTTEHGAQTLVVSEPMHVTAALALSLNSIDLGGLLVRMKTGTRNLDEVLITAGAFEASNDKNKAVLSTMDIVTTAGANADVVKAIQTLPGTQQQGTETGLFVRGGDAAEASIVIDGMVTQNAFFAGAPGVATRSRFSPFQFKGVSFSSGGYSARYGQALSSVLELNTLDLPEKSTVNLGLNMAGVYASGSKLWQHSGADLSLSYNNLSPFYGLANAQIDFDKMPQGLNAGARYAWRPNKDGLFKIMASSSAFSSGSIVADPDSLDHKLHFGIRSQTHYASASYSQFLGDKWRLLATGAYSYNQEQIDYRADYSNGYGIRNQDDRLQGRLEVKRIWSSRFQLTAGTEWQHYSFRRRAEALSFASHQAYTETSAALYTEAAWSPHRWVALRPGLRYERSALLGQQALSPRLSLALRTSPNGQLGLAGGLFFQNPDQLYLLNGYRPGLQQAAHYIANYQWNAKGRTFRTEFYYKDYRQLVRERMATFDPSQYRYYISGVPVDNSGKGYAAGFELFWRDRKTVRNFDYWISYSYIDTRRLYRNYIAEATPVFVADHNLNLVSKYYIEPLQTQLNMTYSFASGRPYYNQAAAVFLGDRTPDYHNLSITVNYLTHIRKWFTVIYAGVDNLTNRQNIFSYRYSADGSSRSPVLPALFRSVFVGINCSLTEFNKDEL